MRPFRRLYKASPRLRRLIRRVKNASVVGMTRFALWAVGRLSLERALRLGERVGVIVYRTLRGQRRLAVEHLRVAFGDALTPAARDYLARASFVNIARCFCELAKIDEIRARRDTYFEVEGWEHAQRLLAEGTGAVIVTGHIGNWELLAAYFAWQGLPVAAIARRIYAGRLNQLLVDFRRRQGVETIMRENPHSTRQILRALKSNALLAMLIDQDTRTPSVSVPFFGRLARTPAAAAALAIRRNLPAVTVFMQRRPEGGHRIIISPPFVVQRSTDVSADIRALTRQFSDALEAKIRKNPAEWVWWHRRWRRPPQPHLDLDGAFGSAVDNAAVRSGEQRGLG
jgi:KDO2-lipid IV(A) lauroyltransferase